MSHYTAFLDGRRIAAGSREALARELARHHANGHGILVFEDDTGRVTDLDPRGEAAAEPQRGVGRPKLGVRAREVTLLPRHWDWLAQQPGGASAALRRLVDAARAGGRTLRERQDAAYRFLQAACGDMPGYEEALRALSRDDGGGLRAATAAWPQDVRAYLARLLGGGEAGEGGEAAAA